MVYYTKIERSVTMPANKLPRSEKPLNVISFIEDDFDFAENSLILMKKKAHIKTREKARIKRVRLQLFLGRIVLAIAAFLIFFLIYYVIYAW